MSVFAFGIVLPTQGSINTFDIIEIAHAINDRVREKQADFHFQFGGNAEAYWRVMRNSRLQGLQFDITNSIVENTAEEVFRIQNTYVSMEDSIRDLKVRLESLQKVFEFVLQIDSVKSVLFCQQAEPDTINVDSFVACNILDFSAKLLEYCTGNYSEIALRLTY